MKIEIYKRNGGAERNGRHCLLLQYRRISIVRWSYGIITHFQNIGDSFNLKVNFFIIAVWPELGE